MQPKLPTSNASKRRMVRSSVNERTGEERELQPAVLPIQRVASTETQPAKRSRGRPKKNVQIESAMASNVVDPRTVVSNNTSFHTMASRDLDELDYAVEALMRKVRPSTALAYRQPLAHWKGFCDANKHRFNIDSEYPYTVGPTELVVAFFTEFIFKRTYKKNISIGSDVRTQIYLRIEDKPTTSTTLPQCKK
ncbi:hypothetical protein CLU79DRAFT_719723 [Phycomyces nitens]|nr:hypothetical protein CLU79DRAFT_719723 [Phycomyces nitens]